MIENSPHAEQHVSQDAPAAPLTFSQFTIFFSNLNRAFYETGTRISPDALDAHVRTVREINIPPAQKIAFIQALAFLTFAKKTERDQRIAAYIAMLQSPPHHMNGFSKF